MEEEEEEEEDDVSVMTSVKNSDVVSIGVFVVAFVRVCSKKKARNQQPFVPVSMATSVATFTRVHLKNWGT
ncbi:hypothetical protein Tco_0205397 [Tanacetum coccineum]